ncbi:glutamate-5-semialdehyde dehydrogenase [Kiloniella laminariae]|uniref:Gamma-glutamyl phosphate reductase n=2 Tax=Kiloniella laminariae TaxID=454162 RepID=A0ABT4LMJ9_9PROT|nr:glutamate-5-semialdehyde dehydrogenase [Kiloniella laminariae]MCZ4282317.1 glutamate-5-semialdehyde dehydrogenase [Kiloniella laminariae]
MSELKTRMDQLGQAAKEAAGTLALASPEIKNQALYASASALRDQTETILLANAKDMAAAQEKGLSSALLDRLALTPERVEAMAAGLEAIAAFPDPVGASLASWEQPNGLKFERVSVPLGVIGIIYESRPNVTADAGALCLKAGNAAILRGGSESYHSSGAILKCLQAGLETAGLPVAAIQCVPTTDRAAVGHLLTMNGIVDLIIPRGGRGLIERIQNESRVPVLAHLDGLCHTYLHASASPSMALEIVLNAKMRRTGVCGATETLLVDQDFSDNDLKPILEALMAKGCEIRGDENICALDHRVVPATAADWDTEYLDAILSVRKVPDLAAAIAHIARHGSSHTEAIIAEDLDAVTTFQKQVDAGIVIHNASTQYADGGEFGMGAEIGISTGKLHARGPVGASQLTSYKYLVRGSGQVRP